MAKLNTSTSLVVNTELVPFDTHVELVADGSKEQWYYENTAEDAPDRTVTPLTITPTLTLYDRDSKISYTNASCLSVVWRVQQWVSGDYQTTVINTTDASADFYTVGSTLKVRKNCPDASHGINITCEYTYIDPRDSNVHSQVTAQTDLMMNLDANLAAPVVELLSPSAQRYNPLKDESSIFKVRINCKIGGTDAFLRGEAVGYEGTSSKTWTENATDGCLETTLDATDINYNAECLIDGTYDFPYDADLSADDTCRFKEGKIQVKTNKNISNATLWVNYITVNYAGDLSLRELMNKTIDYIDWRIRKGNDIPTYSPITEDDPFYVSGLDSMELVIDALYSGSISISPQVWLVSSSIQNKNTVTTSIEWSIPRLDCTVVGENGQAVRSDTGGMEFSTIVNMKDETLSEEKKRKHLRFNWKSRPAESANGGAVTVTDRGWGDRMAIADDELRRTTSVGGGTMSDTLINFETYLLSPYVLLDYGELFSYEYVTGEDGETKIMGRMID